MSDARTPRRGLLRRLRPAAGDAGLTLIELMVSLVVFSIAATGIAAGFTTAIKTSGNDRNRLAAANLAQREIEIVRNEFTATKEGPVNVLDAGSAVNPHPLPGGTSGQPLVVDGREYTVTRSLVVHTGEPGVSSCEGGAAVEYPRFGLDVTVTWVGMGSIHPVEAHTVLTPPRGILNSNMSFVAVNVIDAAGMPNEGRKVQLAPGGGAPKTAYTQADGCAVFAVSTTGTHVVSLDEAGYVDVNGQRETSKSLNINASSFNRADFSYDRAAGVTVRLSAPAGHVVPDDVAAVTLGSTGLATDVRSYAASTTPTTIGSLWPISSGYEVWAGSCMQSDPAAAGGARNAPVAVPGVPDPAVVDIPLAPMDIVVRSGTPAGPPVVGRSLVARPLSDESCFTAEREISLGSTDAAGSIKTALPAGQWEVRVNGSTPLGGEWPLTSPLLPTETASTLTVVVS